MDSQIDRLQSHFTKYSFIFLARVLYFYSTDKTTLERCNKSPRDHSRRSQRRSKRNREKTFRCEMKSKKREKRFPHPLAATPSALSPWNTPSRFSILPKTFARLFSPTSIPPRTVLPSITLSSPVQTRSCVHARSCHSLSLSSTPLAFLARQNSRENRRFASSLCHVATDLVDTKTLVIWVGCSLSESISDPVD